MIAVTLIRVWTRFEVSLHGLVSNLKVGPGSAGTVPRQVYDRTNLQNISKFSYYYTSTLLFKFHWQQNNSIIIGFKFNVSFIRIIFILNHYYTLLNLLLLYLLFYLLYAINHQQSGQCIFCTGILEMTIAYFAYCACYFAYFAYCMQY